VTQNGLHPAAGAEVRTALYDYANASSTTAGVTLTTGSQVVSVNTLNATAAVPDGTAADLVGALVPRWRGETPGRALSFDGKTQYLSGPNAPKICPTADLTLEAWANPTFVTGRSRILYTSSIYGTKEYALGLEASPLNSALQFNTATDWVDCGSSLALAGTDFTIELWARRMANGPSFLFGHGAPVMTDPNLVLAFNDTGNFCFGPGTQLLSTPSAYPIWPGISGR
jgi:hypothetical protein